jgi:hypothetical protein
VPLAKIAHLKAKFWLCPPTGCCAAFSFYGNRPGRNHEHEHLISAGERHPLKTMESIFNNPSNKCHFSKEGNRRLEKRGRRRHFCGNRFKHLFRRNGLYLRIS